MDSNNYLSLIKGLLVNEENQEVLERLFNSICVYLGVDPDGAVAFLRENINGTRVVFTLGGCLVVFGVCLAFERSWFWNLRLLNRIRNRTEIGPLLPIDQGPHSSQLVATGADPASYWRLSVVQPAQRFLDWVLERDEEWPVLREYRGRHSEKGHMLAALAQEQLTHGYYFLDKGNRYERRGGDDKRAGVRYTWQGRYMRNVGMYMMAFARKILDRNAGAVGEVFEFEMDGLLRRIEEEPEDEDLLEQPQPGAVQPQPGAVQPQPGAVQPQPAAVQPQPAAVQPQPAAVQPQPGAVQPQPGAVQPQPGAVQPQPGAVQPQPGAGPADGQ